MLKSYEAIYHHGKIQWLTEPPKAKSFKMLVVVEQADPENNHVKFRRVPPPELKGSIQWHGDPLEPVISEEEWEVCLERTARQLEGDPEAFK